MKVLICIISHTDNDINSCLNVLQNKIITPLQKDNYIIKIGLCTTNKNNYCSKLIDYNFNYNLNGQLSKICHLINNIDEIFDYYIKIRPEVILHTEINHNFLESLSKNKINSRVRQYSGPPINIKNGISCQHPSNHHIQLNELVIINPDDQMYIFHKNCLDAFSIINNNTYIEYCNNLINLQKKYWIDDWMYDINYWYKNTIEREGHHKFIWYYRGFEINPIGLNLQMRNLHSIDLIIK